MVGLPFHLSFVVKKDETYSKQYAPLTNNKIEKIHLKEIKLLSL